MRLVTWILDRCCLHLASGWGALGEMVESGLELDL